ncbi:hypothetical protein GY45DRAFT_202310 [Cubamyces sp. BRFM 1775]|nr:hypothetical protein GY45DRAFT_202310 [Cubamyces sp. BRFM 1775]
MRYSLHPNAHGHRTRFPRRFAKSVPKAVHEWLLLVVSSPVWLPCCGFVEGLALTDGLTRLSDLRTFKVITCAST